MKLLSKALPLALTLAALGASATTYAPPVLNTGVVTVGPGAFTTDYSLGNLTRGGLSASAFTIEIAPLFNIAHGTLELFSGTIGHGREVGSIALSANTHAYSFNIPTTGKYYFQISGNATGMFGGAYDILAYANVHAVPEPEVTALLAAGGIGLLLSRRRKKSQQAIAA